MMKLLQWRYSLLLLPILWFSIDSAQADVTCTASMNSNTVNISNTITPANANDAEITATLSYSCTNNTESSQYVSVCLGADGGDKPNAVIPRYMKAASNNHELAFNMTLPDGNIWGTRTSGLGKEYNSGAIYIPARSTMSGQNNISGQVVINIFLLPNSTNTLATPGTYTNNFNGNLIFKTAENPISTNCLEGVQNISHSFPFTVQATVIPSCRITAKPTDINLGNIAASATSIKGNTNISLQCTNTAPYTIGLSPSNGNVDGAGIMTSAISNSDVVPYRLQSDAGKVWGNTANAENVGNGVAGKGDGTTKLHTVHVIVPNADVKPGSYSDTVTINVNY